MDHRNKRVAEFVRSLFMTPGTNEILEVHTSDLGQRYVESSGESEELVDSAVQGLKSALEGGDLTQQELEGLEAIVLRDKCPTFATADDVIVDVGKGEWARLQRDTWLTDFIQAVGRLDCEALSAPYAGSGFLVGDDLVLTNRHVARLFAEGVGLRKELRLLYAAEIDYRHEKTAPSKREPFVVEEVVLVHPYWDVALLRVSHGGSRRPVTLAHEAPSAIASRPIAVVGYPFFRFTGSEYDRKVLLDNFGDTPGYKRVQPGRLTQLLEYVSERDAWPRVKAVAHNASTLGGNSGSLVVDLDAKCALAVHFAGRAFVTNWAVPSWELYRDPRVRAANVKFTGDGKDAPLDPLVESAWAARGGSAMVSVPAAVNGKAAPVMPPAASAKSEPSAKESPPLGPSTPQTEVNTSGVVLTTLQVPLEVSIRLLTPALARGEAGRHAPETSTSTEALEAINFDNDYADRLGYDPEFLDVVVELPTLTSSAMALVSRDRTRDSEDNHILHYHHFSLVVNKRRRVAFFTACNTTRDPQLFGEKTRKELSGSEPWRLDPRIPAHHQITTAEFYKSTVFDRGHIVRREDAYWGDTEDEQEWANFDTFHFTNCSPQHQSYNRSNKQGLWGLLENQIGSESAAKDLRMTLFSGPVFAPRDPVLWGVRVPRQFWKVVASVDDRTGELGAWAFLLSQAKLVATVEEEIFDPGALGAQQIPLRRLHDLTDVRFPDALLRADTFRDRGTRASAAPPA
jgi:endonuclease G